MPSPGKKKIKKNLNFLEDFPRCLMIIICNLRGSQKLEVTFLHEYPKFDTNTKFLQFPTSCQNVQALSDVRVLSYKTH